MSAHPPACSYVVHKILRTLREIWLLTEVRIMNVGSPFNVQAGSQVQMEKVIEKYKKLAYEDNERKLEALRNNQIKSEQPFDKARIKKAPDSI